MPPSLRTPLWQIQIVGIPLPHGLLCALVVVLSACWTATSRLFVGEVVQGLTAPSPLGGCPQRRRQSLGVDDRATAQLMGDFYEVLLAAEPLAMALATGRQAARGLGEPAGAWGGFVVVGDPWAKPELAAAPGSRVPPFVLLGVGGAATVRWARRRPKRAG